MKHESLDLANTFLINLEILRRKMLLFRDHPSLLTAMEGKWNGGDEGICQ